MPAAALAAVAWILFFSDLGAVPFYSVGEPREGVQVLAALDRGEWILPLRNGTELPSKPPLFHWLASLSAVGVGDADELALRLPSAVLATVTIFLIVWFAARRWDTAAGWYAGFVLATNVGWIKLARSARVDMTLAACITAACLCFERAVAHPLPPPPLMLWGFYIGMGLGALAKGPVGIAVPLLVAAIHLAVTRQLGRWRELAVGWGLAVALAIPGAWYVAAAVQGGMPFIRKQILRENVLRVLGTGAALRNEGHPIYYYAYEFVGGFLPWSVFLVPLAIYLVQQRRRPEVWRPYQFPLLWFATVLAVFTAAAGKRSTYILSAYPAAALMLGAWWSAVTRRRVELSSWVRRAMRLTAAIAAVATGLLVVVLGLHAVGLDPLEWIRPLLHRKDQQNLPLVRGALADHWPTAVAWAASAAAAAWMLRSGARRSDWWRVFAALVLYVVATVAVIHRAFTPRLAADRTYKPFMAEVQRAVADPDRLFFYGDFDYGAIFYARRHIPELDRRMPDGDAPAWVLFTEREWQEMPAAGRARGAIVAESHGTGPEGRARLLLVRIERNPVPVPKLVPEPVPVPE